MRAEADGLRRMRTSGVRPEERRACRRLSPDASVRSMKVTAEAARRFLVAQASPRAGSVCPTEIWEGVLEVFRRLGSIQFDPIAVAGRSHDLELHARVADYEASLVRPALRAPVKSSRRTTRGFPSSQSASSRGFARR